MTNADVQQVITNAREKFGRDDVTWDDAAIYLKAREYLLAPDHPKARSAKTVITNFSYWVNAGERRQSFDEFDIDPIETDEEIADREKRRAEYFDYYRKYALVGIKQDDYTAAVKLRERLGLTCQQIIAMTDAEFMEKVKSNA